MDDDGGNRCGRQGAHDVFGRLIGPADNVDSLIHQFAGNGLNTRAFDTDAASDRINALVLNLDGNFGTDAGIAGNALDLKQAFVDFGNDLTHQFAQEFIAGTGQGDLLLSGGRIDFQNISANTIARTEVFHRDHLMSRQTSIDAADFDNRIALVKALDLAGDNLNVLVAFKEFI